MEAAENDRSVSRALTLVTPTQPAHAHLPIGLFGSVMGVTGLSVAWQFAHVRYGAPEAVALSIAVIAVVAFVLVVTGYTLKILTAFPAVREEFRHPIAGNLFGTLPISLLQLPTVIEPFAHRLAQFVWLAGAASMSFFAWFAIGRWMTNRKQVAHASPAWMIPVAGVLQMPLALPTLGLPQLHGLMVAALAIGMFFTVPFFTLILSRLLVGPSVPPTLKPSLLILVAPFAVGYSTYTVTVGQTDLFAEALYVLTLFMLALLLGQLRNLHVCCPFRVSWWSVSFPLASGSVAAIRFAAAKPDLVTDTIAMVLLAIATMVIAGLLVVTLVALARGDFAGFDIRSEEEHQSISDAKAAKTDVERPSPCVRRSARQAS